MLIKDLKMRSSLIVQVNPNAMTSISVKDTQRRGPDSIVKEAKIGVRQPQPTSCKQPTRTVRSKNRLSP